MNIFWFLYASMRIFLPLIKKCIKDGNKLSKKLLY